MGQSEYARRFIDATSFVTDHKDGANYSSYDRKEKDYVYGRC